MRKEVESVGQLRLLGYDVKLFNIKDLIRNEEKYAEIIFADMRFNFDAEMDPQAKQGKLCHEIAEFWAQEGELGLPHDKIQVLGAYLHQFLMDNNPYVFVPCPHNGIPSCIASEFPREK